jgi:putative ABC transport system permease protein
MFGQPLKVAATINDTGMGFDSAVFMTLETAQHMIELSEKTAVHPAGPGKDNISALFIKLDSGSDVSKVAEIILNRYPQTDVVALKEMMQRVSVQMNNIRGLAYGIEVLLWIVSILILTVVFNVTFHASILYYVLDIWKPTL